VTPDNPNSWLPQPRPVQRFAAVRAQIEAQPQGAAAALKRPQLNNAQLGAINAKP